MGMRTTGATGPLDRLVRRVDQLKRVMSFGTPAPGQQLGQPTPPRPPSPDPSVANLGAPPPPPIDAGIGGFEAPIPGMGSFPSGPPPPATQMAPPPDLVSEGTYPIGVDESPATRFYRENGVFPTYLSLAIMNAKAQIERETGQSANQRQVMERLMTRDYGETVDDFRV